MSLREAQRRSSMPHRGQVGTVKNVRDDPVMLAKYCLRTKPASQSHNGSSIEVKRVDIAEIKLDSSVLDICGISSLSSIRFARANLRPAMRKLKKHSY
jgi:hypothetical protein